MKFLPLRDFENVTSALNFDTTDCHVQGGCDLYTTKAAGSDKKLYKTIENSLESQYDSLVRLSASLSPPQSELFSLSLSRPSPFGSLDKSASRRTFAYLIATLNASHPDYDFSNELRPSDFRRERSLRTVTNTIDETLYNLRPRHPGYVVSGIAGGHTRITQNQTPAASAMWGPNMWRMVDQEMTLRECEIYSYSPDDDPFDGEENALWSLNYFFFNKRKKRVCYIYLRGLSISSHSPVPETPIAAAKRPLPTSARNPSVGATAGKRARYWLGEKANDYLSSGCEKDDEVPSFQHAGDDEVDADDVMLGPSDYSSHDFTESDDDETEMMYRTKSAVRHVSEDIMESMDMEV